MYVFVPASGFVILSFLRKKINAPRPYEEWDIKPLLDRDSPGQSMPSRHVFSATIISKWLAYMLVLSVGGYLIGLVSPPRSS